MASKQVFLLAFVLSSWLGLASACDYYCPPNFVIVYDSSTTCGYACLTPANFACLGNIGQPIACGGTTGKPCPSIACTASYSAAYSGPTGCARAKNAVAAFTISQTSYAFDFTHNFFSSSEICSGSGNPVIYAQDAANAYASAIATTLIQYCNYACTCCTGNSAAWSVAVANVQAVAAAYAEAAQQALATVTCYGDLLAGASAVTDAWAQDTQLAVDRAFSVIYASGGRCVGTGLQTQVQQAVAQALACSFFQIYAAYDVYNNVPNSYSCSATAALSGPGWSVDQCLITYCPV